MLDISRYNRDFCEIALLGKGGYGKVYRVAHKIDGLHYAVKKINLSPARLRKIELRGQQELDSLLVELRTLARLDHPNIVRYYSGWLECTSSGVNRQDNNKGKKQPRLLVGLPEAEHTDAPASSSIGDLVVFGDSNHSSSKLEDESSQHVYMKASVRKANWDENALPSSPVTIASAASIEEREAVFPGANAGSQHSAKVLDSEAGVELPTTQPVAHNPTNLEISTSEHDLTSESQGGPSDYKSILTLHIQMSLHPLTLAKFLEPELPRLGPNEEPTLRHCFHVLVSLQILSAVLQGIKHLHKHGLIHRDLKPGNIFLSTYEGQARSPSHVNISSCSECFQAPVEIHQYLDVRIGDFGLVTSIACPDADSSDSAVNKPVGTKFYQPPKPSRMANEKMDIFAFGIIAFELLWKFDTREISKLLGMECTLTFAAGMERYEVLQELRKGVLPHDFCAKFGQQGEALHKWILGMTCAEEGERFSCDTVEMHLNEIMQALTKQEEHGRA
jgi:eukaryotic translation initiation factor 2-alpha kinase 3